MITNFNREHRNTSFYSLTRMRDNIRSVFTEDNILILYISSDKIFHNSYHRLDINKLIGTYNFLCTFANHISQNRVLPYLGGNRDLLNIRFRQNRINSTNLYTSRNVGDNVFIRSMVLVPLFLGNLNIRGKSIKTFRKNLRIKSKLIANITKAISSHTRFNAFIIIVYT